MSPLVVLPLRALPPTAVKGLTGDFSFLFDITPTPIARSLKAYVNWTDAGFATYFEAFEAT